MADYATSPLYDEAERVALEYADRMTISGRDVDDAFFARLRRFYDDESDCRRVCSARRAHEVGSGALRPDLELLLGGGSEGVRSTDDDAAAVVA